MSRDNMRLSNVMEYGLHEVRSASTSAVYPGW